jgi:hypothetical protein
VADLFDPPAGAALRRRARAAKWSTRSVIGRIGCQWRYLPERYVAWTAVWAQWRRWRANGVWAAAMSRLASIVRVLHERKAAPSMPWSTRRP